MQPAGAGPDSGPLGGPSIRAAKRRTRSLPTSTAAFTMRVRYRFAVLAVDGLFNWNTDEVWFRSKHSDIAHGRPPDGLVTPTPLAGRRWLRDPQPIASVRKDWAGVWLK
jgi:hypothetical protein